MSEPNDGSTTGARGHQEVGQAAAADAELKIFRLNEHEWWIGATIDECFRAAEKFHGLPRWEVQDELFASYELAKDEMEGKFVLTNFGPLPMGMAYRMACDDTASLPRLLGNTLE